MWIDGTLHSSIPSGMLILLGVGRFDNEAAVKHLVQRCSTLRIFDDGDGKMNLSILDVGGSAMVVSQFTLFGDTRKGNRPNYAEAAPPEIAERLYNLFVAELGSVLGKERVSSGMFRAMMDVELVNDGPVTLMLESPPSKSGDRA